MTETGQVAGYVGPWRNRIVRYGMADPEQMLANPLNFRIHPQFQQAALEGVLDEVGLAVPIVAQAGTDTIIDGHMRVTRALARGQREIPCVWVDLDDDEVAKALATIDPISGLAVHDQEQLDELLASIETESDALAELFDSLAGETAAAAEAAREREPEVRISPELLERQDYLVFIFDNELDWRAICDEFGIGKVYEKDPATVRKGVQSANQGTGRVLMGSELLGRLRGATDGEAA